MAKNYGWTKLNAIKYQSLLVNVLPMPANTNLLLAISQTAGEHFALDLFNIDTNAWQNLNKKYSYKSEAEDSSHFIIAATLDKNTETLCILSHSQIELSLLCIDFNNLLADKTIEPRQFKISQPFTDVTEILFENGRLHAIANILDIGINEYVMWDTNKLSNTSDSVLPFCVKNNIKNAKKNTHLLYANNQKKVLLYGNHGVYELKINSTNDKNDDKINRNNNTNIEKSNLINNTNNHSNNNTNNNNNSDNTTDKDQINNENLVRTNESEYNQKWCLITKFNSNTGFTKPFYPVIVTDCGRYLLKFCASRNHIHIHDLIHHQVFLSKIYCPSIGAVPRFATYLHDENQDFITTNAYIHHCYSNISFQFLPVLPEYLVKFITKFVTIEYVHLFYDSFVRKNVHHYDCQWRIKLDAILDNPKPLKPPKTGKKQ